MHWIALLPPEGECQAWGWRALQFTPRVAQVGDALLLEVESCARLWGGPHRLARRLVKPRALQPLTAWAQAPTSLVALALLRLRARGEDIPSARPAALPLHTLAEAQPHVPLLERLGCRTWGDLRGLPRGGVARRFGAPLLDALDAAWGLRPERYAWLTLPESFEARLELPALATSAPELLWGAQRLLAQMQAWLAARQRGVLALELEWTLDLKRMNGVNLPAHERLTLRTAQPTQEMAHLRRLMAEHLARASLSAPASWLRLRSLQTVPWAGASTSLLPEDNVKGERLHQLVERLSARLGDTEVLLPQPGDDHRPERMQRWVPARGAGEGRGPGKAAAIPRPLPDALFPTWMLPDPIALEVHNSVPWYGGPLRRLTRPWRMEAGWWEEGECALRDYFIAQSPQAGLVWIYRERPRPHEPALERMQGHRWFLQGLYA